jgi:hypothetical protein
MGTLWITELTSRSADGLARLPSVASQSIPIAATAAVSAPISNDARAVRLFADADCTVAVGGGEPIPIAAHRPESFSVNAGETVEVVGRAMQNNTNDPFALFSIIADPEASKRRMKELKAAAGELSKLQAEVAASQSALAERQATAEQAQADAKAKADAELAQVRQDFENERSRTANALAAREARVVELEARAAADAEEAGRMKADLRRRLDLLHEASVA